MKKKLPDWIFKCRKCKELIKAKLEMRLIEDETNNKM